MELPSRLRELLCACHFRVRMTQIRFQITLEDLTRVAVAEKIPKIPQACSKTKVLFILFQKLTWSMEKRLKDRNLPHQLGKEISMLRQNLRRDSFKQPFKSRIRLLAKGYQVEVECAQLRQELGMHSKSIHKSRLKDRKKVLLKVRVPCKAKEK